MNFFKMFLFLFLFFITSSTISPMLDPVYTGDQSANNDFYGVNDTGSGGRVLQVKALQEDKFQEKFLDTPVSVQDLEEDEFTEEMSQE